jgi:hypothetical protein
MQRPMTSRHSPGDETSQPSLERSFRGWRLLGVLGAVVLVLAVISAAVDIWVLGPILERF